MKTLFLLPLGWLLVSCGEYPNRPPVPDHDTDAAYARSPREFRDEMLTPVR